MRIVAAPTDRERRICGLTAAVGRGDSAVGNDRCLLRAFGPAHGPRGRLS
jgi:hypothetical protein